MAVSVKNTSRLLLGELKLIDGITFWDILDLPMHIPQPDDVTYITSAGDRLDTIAQNFYQDPLLMWVIAWANDIELIDPVVESNATLIIPSSQYVKTKLLAGQVTSSN